MTARIIVGIDPGYDRLGIAVLEKKDKEREKLIFSECVTTHKKDSESIRLHTVGNAFAKIIETYNPDEIAIEKLFFVKNISTGILVAHVCGIIKYLAKEHNIPLYEYAPTEIKVAITSHGHATKEDVHMMVARLIPLMDKKRKDDEIDAIAIALTHSAYKKVLL